MNRVIDNTSRRASATAPPERIMHSLATLADVTRVYASARGDAPALACAGRTTTFGELDRCCSQVANGLIRAGVGTQTRFGYLCRNTEYVYELFFGAAKASAVPVGLNWRLAPAELEYVLEDAGIEVVFVDAESLPLLESASRARALHLVVVLDEVRPDYINYLEWRDSADSEDPCLPCDPDNVACQLYTSGTTGRPKGVQLTHANFLAQRHAESMCGEWAQWRAGDTALVAMPLYHVGGLSMGLLSLCSGAFTVITKDTDAARLIALIETHGVTMTFLVPTLIQMLLERPEAKYALRAVRALRYGAAPMPAALLRRTRERLRCSLVQVYGMTESAGAITYLPPEDHVDAQIDRRLKSCGKAMPGIYIKIRASDGSDAAPGRIGEICVRGGPVMKGYWKNAPATQQAVQNSWYHSGDAGYMDEDGYIYIQDRIKDMIISGAENIYPAEVESAIFEHPAIQDAAVIGVPDAKWGESVKAIVVLRPNARLTADELIVFVRQRIASYKAPKSVDFVAALPRSPSGKTLKRELRAPFWLNRDRQI
jgi:acyl-CoA synthetase (AMP-forming)/AMP-acid ligase II